MLALGPSRLDDFRLDGAIGLGTTARVFQAQHLESGVQVAIKKLEDAASRSPEHRERLAREAVFLADVQSPHVGRILGYGYDEKIPFLVLERLHGETLDELLGRGTRPSAEQLFAWTAELLLGVRDIHAAGIVHRDIKPSNVFLVSSPSAAGITVKLIDFGVARLREVVGMDEPLTSPSHVIGSLGYMAPEQFEHARHVTPAADLYAVGAVVFHALSGRLPFTERSLERALRLKAGTDAPRLSSVMPDDAAVSVGPGSALDLLLARALARDPAARFQSAREMLDEWNLAREAVELDVLAAPPTVRSSTEALAQAFADGFGGAVVDVVDVTDDEAPITTRDA